MTTAFDFTIAASFGTALAIGALLGLEREQRKKIDGAGSAGLRTFILLSQIGAVAGYLGHERNLPWLLPAALAVIALIIGAGYLVGARQRPDEVGLTTEIAAVLTCLLGALATTGFREIAVGLGVVTAALLAYKKPLHEAVGKLDREDVLAGMRLLLATFVVLPLLPREPVDPWHAIVPYKLWLLALLISSMSFAGYIATRWLGPGRGLAITAVTGGLVSSTAVTLALAKSSREAGEQAGRRFAGGVLLAWAVMFVRVVVTATIVDAALCLHMLPAFVPMTLVCAVFAWLALRGGKGAAGGGEPPPAMTLKNPFSLMAGAKFALLFAVVQLLVKLAQQYLPPAGTYAVAALAGLTDVDAITLTMAQDARADPGKTQFAVLAIAIACFSNTGVKAGLASSLGSGMARTVWIAAVVIVAVGVGGLLLGAALLPAAQG